MEAVLKADVLGTLLDRLTIRADAMHPEQRIVVIGGELSSRSLLALFTGSFREGVSTLLCAVAHL
jgi:hypothetical protein